jgi:hypothetical protein
MEFLHGSVFISFPKITDPDQALNPDPTLISQVTIRIKKKKIIMQ